MKTADSNILTFDKKLYEREQALIAASIRVRFSNCKKGAVKRFVHWAKAMHPEDKISGCLVSRIISNKKRAWAGAISLEKMQLVQLRLQEFFQNIETELAAIQQLVPNSELEKIRLYKVNH